MAHAQEPKIYIYENYSVSPPNRKGMVELSSFLSLAKVKGPLALQASQQVLDELSEMPEHRVKTCLYSLISYYGQWRFNQCVNKRPGSNSPFSKNCWRTARVLFPFIMAWAEGAAKTKSFKTITRALQKEEGYSTIAAHDARRVAAYVVRKNIETHYRRPWPGKDPCIDPSKFQRQLKKDKPLWNGTFPRGKSVQSLNFLPKPSAADIPLLVKAILEGESVVMAYQAGIIQQTSF